MQKLNKLVLDLYSRNEVARSQPYGEVDTRIGESVIAQSRLESDYPAIRMRHQFARHLESDFLDLFKIAFIVHPDVNTDSKFMVGQTEIRDDAARQLAVRHHHHGVVQHDDARVAPAHPDDMSLLTALEFDEMTGLDRLFRYHINSGKQICQSVLKSQGDSQGANAQRSNQGSNRNPNAVQKDQHSEAYDQPAHPALK